MRNHGERFVRGTPMTMSCLLYEVILLVPGGDPRGAPRGGARGPAPLGT